MKQPAFETPVDRLGAAPHRITGRQQRVEIPNPCIAICKAGARLLSLLICSVLLLPGGVFAQEFRATISGRVADPSGAVVPGASIVVEETHTGAISRTTSDGAGQYVVPFLLPGDYSITVTKTGFQTLIRNGIALLALDHPIINLILKIGSETQTVSVTAAAPLLDQANASIGAVVNTDSIENLPQINPAMLAELAPGVLNQSPPTAGSDSSWSIGGSLTNESEATIDGVAALAMSGSGLGELAFAPTQDTVKEVSVSVFDTDASEGHSSSGIVNIVTKNGTNALHGTVYDIGALGGLFANLYYNDRTVPVTPLPSTPFNPEFGLTVGGPVWIPKVINGRNRLFFFFAFDDDHSVTPTTVITTVPTDAEREGDFSALLAGGSSYQLYEPNTGTLGPNGSFTRTPVPNNCLTNKSTYCSSVANAGITIDPIAAAYMKLYPEPNYTSGVSPITNQDNYNSDAPTSSPMTTEFGRMDYNLATRYHTNFNFRHSLFLQNKQNYFGNNSTGSNLFRENWGTTWDNVYTINPTTVFDVRLNWTYYDETHSNPANAISATSVGFPSYMTTASDYPGLPYIEFNSSSYQNFSENGASEDPSAIYQIFGDMTKLVGRQMLKIGFDGRRYVQRLRTYSDAQGQFSFGDGPVECGTGCSAQKFGGDLAAFEYGLPSSGQLDLEPEGDFRQYYVALFAQDDWRVNNHLTLNLGVRFDLDTPYGEKFGRTESGFNFSAVNSASVAAAAAFHPTSVTVNNTTVSVNNIDTLGGLTFPSSDWGAPYQIADKAGFWSPRIGFSYNPPLSSKTLVRGGFGIYVGPQTLQGDDNADGFAAVTNFVASTNNGFTYTGTLDDPFPSGFVQPAGSSAGASTFLGGGSTITYLSPVAHELDSMRWTLGVQQALTGSTLLEVIYEGNHTQHLTDTENHNATPEQYETSNPWRDQNLSTADGLPVPNPFEGLVPLNGSYNAATTTLGALEAPYPAYAGAAINEEQKTNGQSFFEGGILHVEQRTKHGVTLTASYEFSKMLEQDTYLNGFDTTLFRGISPNDDHKQHLTMSGLYELPFGRGKLFNLGGGRLANEIAGGWLVSGIYQFQTGLPVDFSSDIPFQPGMNASNIHSSPRDTSTTVPAIANVSSVFVTGSGTSCTVSAGQPCDGTVFFNGQYADHIRTLPTTFGNVRADGWNNLDAMVTKNIYLYKEKDILQIRFEAINSLNHPFFAAPNVSSATASNFGYITGTASGYEPREVYLGGRFVF